MKSYKVQIIVLILVFIAGRYTANIYKKTEISKITEEHTDIDTHKVTTITEEPGGKKVTTITEDTETETKKKEDIKEKIEVAKNKNLVNISAIASLDTTSRFTPVYGISANKELLGPITVGVFGLTNGVIGVSLGINF